MSREADLLVEPGWLNNGITQFVPLRYLSDRAIMGLDRFRSTSVTQAIARLAILSSACLAFAGVTHAQTIQKCVATDGKVTYQDGACERGTQTTAKIERDSRPADPMAVQRAKEQREWVREATAARVAQEHVDALKAANARLDADRAESQARAHRAEEREDAAANAMSEQPLYYGPLIATPSPKVVIIRETIREAAPVPRPTPLPARPTAATSPTIKKP